MSKETVQRIDNMVRAQLVNIEDDLARAKMQKQADPNWRSGNGETIDEVIAHYKYELDQTRKCLPLP